MCLCTRGCPLSLGVVGGCCLLKCQLPGVQGSWAELITVNQPKNRVSPLVDSQVSFRLFTYQPFHKQ